MSLAHDVTNLLSAIDWKALSAFLLAGGGISVALQIIKHFKGIDSTAVARSLLTIMSVITACATYILTDPTLNTIPAIAKYTLYFVAVAHFWFWLTVSPLYKWFTKLLQEAENYKQITAPQATSVAEPPPESFQA